MTISPIFFVEKLSVILGLPCRIKTKLSSEQYQCFQTHIYTDDYTINLIYLFNRAAFYMLMIFCESIFFCDFDSFRVWWFIFYSYCYSTWIDMPIFFFVFFMNDFWTDCSCFIKNYIKSTWLEITGRINILSKKIILVNLLLKFLIWGKKKYQWAGSHIC